MAHIKFLKWLLRWLFYDPIFPANCGKLFQSWITFNIKVYNAISDEYTQNLMFQKCNKGLNNNNNFDALEMKCGCVAYFTIH